MGTTPIPRLGYCLHLPVVAPAPGDRSPQGYINLDEDPSARSSVKLSVNRFIYSQLLLFLSCVFFTSLSLTNFWLFTASILSLAFCFFLIDFTISLFFGIDTRSTADYYTPLFSIDLPEIIAPFTNAHDAFQQHSHARRSGEHRSRLPYQQGHGPPDSWSRR